MYVSRLVTVLNEANNYGVDDPPLSSAPRAHPSSNIPPLMVQAQAPAIPPLLSSIHRACSSSSMPPLMAQAKAPTIPPLFPSLCSAPRAPFSLSSATPLPIPPNAHALVAHGGSHFYTYHKLFAAKCAIRVAQWNQCPYWGALDTELQNRVFLGCVTSHVRSAESISHSTIICPFINPSIPPCSEPSQPKSTSYVPRTPNISSNTPSRSAPASTLVHAHNNAAGSCIFSIFVAALTPTLFVQYKKLLLKMLKNIYRLL